MSSPVTLRYRVPALLPGVLVGKAKAEEGQGRQGRKLLAEPPDKRRPKARYLRTAKRLRALRGSRSQRQFARDLGVAPQVIQRAERGTVPAFDLLVHLAGAGVRLDWLLLGEGPVTRSRPPSFTEEWVHYEPAWETIRAPRYL